ncbi:MAG: NUDIX domain-containing protein [Candidatus Pacebacteria bacterium]|nr:NUDIX domain-containing protein [Candidatus Paceibacterota bacterium]
MKEAHRLIITNGTQVLLGLRHPDDKEGDKWHIMGGKADENEDSRIAVRREIREEVGLDIEPGELTYLDEYNGWITYYYFAFYDGEIGQGDGENTDIKWFDFAEIMNLSLAFNHLDVLLDFLEKFNDKLG